MLFCCFLDSECVATHNSALGQRGEFFFATGLLSCGLELGASALYGPIRSWKLWRSRRLCRETERRVR